MAALTRIRSRRPKRRRHPGPARSQRRGSSAGCHRARTTGPRGGSGCGCSPPSREPRTPPVGDTIFGGGGLVNRGVFHVCMCTHLQEDDKHGDFFEKKGVPVERGAGFQHQLCAGWPSTSRLALLCFEKTPATTAKQKHHDDASGATNMYTIIKQRVPRRTTSSSKTALLPSGLGQTLTWESLKMFFLRSAPEDHRARTVNTKMSRRVAEHPAQSIERPPYTSS